MIDLPHFLSMQHLNFTPSFHHVLAKNAEHHGQAVPLYLLAPSGFSMEAERNERALQRLIEAGFYIINPQVVLRRDQRFAGSDDERLADLRDLLTMSDTALPKIILSVRGGYGAMRLLDGLTVDEWRMLAKKLANRGTLVFGFSDITAIELALLTYGHLPTAMGVMLSGDFGAAEPNAFTMQHFVDLCQGVALDVCVKTPQQYLTQNAATLTGTIWGGNLTVLSALVGTPYLPQIDDGILLLEDIGEQPYRLERMLQTLRLSGVLARQQALLLGQFSLGKLTDAYASDYDLAAVITYLHQQTGLPIYTDFPFGHVASRVSVPLGVTMTLTAVNGGASGYRAKCAPYFSLQDEPFAERLDFNQLLA